MSENWWGELYDDHLATMLLERADPSELQAELGFLFERLELQPGARVFDQCCGIGSLSLALAERAVRLIGVDQAASYVARAQAEARSRGLEAEFVAGDAFEYVPSEPCQAAFNWWTSFGYAETDAQNLRMLSAAWRALAPGGVFVLDTLNLPGVLRDFQRHVVTRRETAAGTITLIRESQLDLRAGRLQKCWTYLLSDGKRVEHQSSLRLYMPHDLAELLVEAGFGEVELYGSIRGEVLGVDSPRCILRARRPR